jgi:hypothetical protein
MTKLLNGILLCSLALAPGFASPLSRFNQLFAKDILALHTTISLDPSVTVQDDGRGSTAPTSHGSDVAASLPVALPIGTPEPGSVFLLLAGGALIVLLRKRYTLNSR